MCLSFGVKSKWGFVVYACGISGLILVLLVRLSYLYTAYRSPKPHSDYEGRYTNPQKYPLQTPVYNPFKETPCMEP